MATKVVFESKKKPITHSTTDESLKTNYDLEFVKKSVPKEEPYTPPELMPEIMALHRDPIAEAFRPDLFTDYDIALKPHPENYETGTAFYGKLLAKNPSLVKVVDAAVDQSVVRARQELYDGRTAYQVDYCAINDHQSEQSSALPHSMVPEHWKPIPQTMYRLNYRDHSKTVTWNIVPKPAKQPPSFFDPDPMEREILNVRTGVSEYEGRIGRLGAQVLKKQYHGQVQPLPGEYVPSADPTPSEQHV